MSQQQINPVFPEYSTGFYAHGGPDSVVLKDGAHVTAEQVVEDITKLQDRMALLIALMPHHDVKLMLSVWEREDKR